MRCATSTDSPFACPLAVDGIHVLPILHEHVEFADLVRGVVAELQPDAVAVEIPSSIERVWLRAVDRLPQISIVLYRARSGRTVYLPVQPADPLVEAARSARERGIPVVCADLEVAGYADYRDPVPDPYALVRLGLDRVFEAFRALPRPRDAEDARRESCMAYHARRLRTAGAHRVLLLCGMHHAEAVARELGREQAIPLTPPARKEVRLLHLHPESLGEVLADPPFHAAVYEARRAGIPDEPLAQDPDPAVTNHGPFRVLSGSGGTIGPRIERAVRDAARDSAVEGARWPAGAGPAPLDRLRLQWSLCRGAEELLACSAPDEGVESWQRRLLARFARNLAIGNGRLVVDLFDLIVAARGTVSDNFAWEMHRLATAYPLQLEQASDAATSRVRADELYDGVRRLRLRRLIRRPKRPDWRRLLQRRRTEERWPGEWVEGFDTASICSYPPEDLLVEDFGRYLRRRGKSVLREERSRTVPFTTSMLDGIDVRETIRNWQEGRIMVRELGRAPGEVGSVVVVFEDEPFGENARFPYLQTWHGEHAQESDMAFYCTDPASSIVGPGICRAGYGGFLLSHPPRRMADVWTDADYRMARTKAEVLLLAALDYSVERVVVHVAARPPRTELSGLAAMLQIKLLHLPLGTLSPATLRKIRVLHILSGQKKRSIAKDYIW